MSASTSAVDAAREPSEPWHRRGTLVRSARLWSGIVLMLFAATHFVNHAVGVFGVDAMTAVQQWRVAFWRSPPGTVLLFGAAAVHVSFALGRAIRRRSWRMPWMEALQIALGVTIPFLLIGHVVATRVLTTIGGGDDAYVHVLRNLWPGLAWNQSLLLIVVWVHGVIGLYFAFHVRAWFRPFRIPFAVLAVLIPALSLAGFVAAGREALSRETPQQVITEQQYALYLSSMSTGWMLLYAAAALVLSAVAIGLVRARLRSRITIRYLGHGEVAAKPGSTLLEISRDNSIPHPSACGGRGRCSSCRVVVLQGLDAIPSPADIERRMLDRIGAPPQVRLACQVRPNADLDVRILFAAKRTSPDVIGLGGGEDEGSMQDMTVLFADIRGFSTLARNQLPVDLLQLLNRVMGEMIQAVEAREGRIAMMQTDGVMAVFGLGRSARTGSRAALHAATDMLKAVHLINKDIRAAFPQPIRIGIGVHSGQAVLAQADDGAGAQRMVVIGETVVIASRLEEATKEMAADCVVSVDTIAAAGLSPPASGERQVHYKNGSQPVSAYAFSDRQDMRALLGRGGQGAVAPAASAAQAVG
jgi:adenylate cyclase